MRHADLLPWRSDARALAERVSEAVSRGVVKPLLRARDSKPSQHGRLPGIWPPHLWLLSDIGVTPEQVRAISVCPMVRKGKGLPLLPELEAECRVGRVGLVVHTCRRAPWIWNTTLTGALYSLLCRYKVLLMVDGCVLDLSTKRDARVLRLHYELCKREDRARSRWMAAMTLRRDVGDGAPEPRGREV